MKLLIIIIGLTSTLAQPNSDGNLVNQASPEPPEVTTVKQRPSVVDIPDIRYAAKPQFDYAEALAKSMLFYEAQRSGKLPDDQRVKWRGDSALNDGSDNNVDLSGGYYDGAGYIKYGYTMAFATTVMSWGVIRYRRAYEILGQLDHVLATIKWATDYFIKCHNDTYVLYAQVSKDSLDTQYWGTPEDMNYRRPSFKITPEAPGSDLAGETAAAMAAASIVFYPTDRDYAAELLRHSEELYDFATRYKGKYSDSIPASRGAYVSGDFEDDLAWSAAWLYKRTGQVYYLREAEQYYKNGRLNQLATEFSWKDKAGGVQVLLAELTGKKQYKQRAQWFCEYAQPESTSKFRSRSKYTPGGLLFVNQWGPLRYAANTAFLCSMVADLKLNATVNRVFAAKQINYMLGEAGRSFVVGFGENPTVKPFHKSSYCPTPPDPCPRFDEQVPNSHILYGALIGGPGSDDSFADQRSNQKQNSVTVDFNAGFQSALAALLDLYIFGPNHRPHYDQPGDINVDEATLPPPTASTTPKPIVGIDYGEVLKKSLLFYEAQRSGDLPPNNRIPWRGDSALKDRANNIDLTGGYYDGAGNIKYGFPLCYSMTMLSWGLIEYKDAYKQTGQYKNAISALRWGMDYIIKTHVHSSANYIVAQIGDPSIDAQWWERPEDMNASRPIYSIDSTHPGTELEAEMVASMAAASIVFQYEDGHYSSLLFNHSAYIFKQYATRKPRQKYTDEISAAVDEYPSSGYDDELAWAAAWLYKNKKHQTYYQPLKTYYSSDRPSDFSWDNKTAGVQLLLGVADRDGNDIGTFCNWLLLSAPRTSDGLLYLNKKYPAKYAANAAFILLLTFEKFPGHPNAKKWRDLGYQQVQYLLGSTGQSYMIGYGKTQPTQPYHRGSSCPDSPTPCGFSFKTVDASNPQKLIGALVGGPDRFGQFEDKRVNTEQSRVSLDGNAGFQAAVAAIQHLKINNLLGNTANSIFASLSKGIIFSLLSFVLLNFLSVFT